MRLLKAPFLLSLYRSFSRPTNALHAPAPLKTTLGLLTFLALAPLSIVFSLYSLSISLSFSLLRKHKAKPRTDSSSCALVRAAARRIPSFFSPLPRSFFSFHFSRVGRGEPYGTLSTASFSFFPFPWSLPPPSFFPLQIPYYNRIVLASEQKRESEWRWQMTRH